MSDEAVDLLEIDGAFYGEFGNKNGMQNGELFDDLMRHCYFDASRSNGTYGTSSTVQPPSAKLLPCIKS